jgi:hypothetical protein
MIPRSGWRWRWRLSGSKHPVRSHMFNVVAKFNGRWEAPTHSFPLPLKKRNPTTLLFIIMRSIQIWIETTHFFFQVVKFTIILMIVLCTFRGILCLWPHKIESPWPLHSKHSHWSKRRSRSKFPSHYARETDGICECKMDVKSTWVPTWHRMDHVSRSLGLFSKTTSWR